MLIPNLSVLLAERRLTLSRVSSETGISRTTLTSLANGGARGIQFETLNTLCQYLRVAPGDLFAYRPFDLAVSATGRPGPGAVVFTVRRAGRCEERFALNCDVRQILAEGAPHPALQALRVRLSLPRDGSPDAARAAELVALLRSLPAPALADLEFEILRAFDRNIDPTAAPADYSPELEWPW